MKVAVIGGGIIGLSSAYYLNRAGCDVTVIDQGDLKDGCSFGNAGMIVPSHVVPLSSPGMIAKGIRWMFNASSPFYVRPSLSSDLMQWGYQFYKHTTKAHVEKSIPALKELSLFSKSLFREWQKDLPFDFGYQERGLLMLFQRDETEREEKETVHQLSEFGVEAHWLSPGEVQKMETEVKVNVKGGVYYPGDANLIPGILVNNLISYLKEKGVVFKLNSRVESFKTSSGSIQSLKISNEEITADEYVIATGSWSGVLLSRLGISLPMQGGKGYSFTIPEVEKNVCIPSIFLEARVAVTPMGRDLRFGGTMEIVGDDHSINMKRVKGIVDSIPQYYPEMKVAMPKIDQVWHGLRPCSPDGLPYIGRTSRYKNLTIATGHSMMGLSLGPGTGKLVSEIIAREKSSINLEAFRPNRLG